MKREEINTMKYKICCPMCDNEKCARGTDSCEAERWAKCKAESEELGDYPDAIHDQFDNMTGSMNL